MSLSRGATFFWRVAVGLLTCGTLSCSKGGINSSGSSSNSGNFSIQVKSVYPSGQGQGWTPIVDSGRYYVKGLSLTVEGTCSRGIGSIKVDEGSSPYAEVAQCQENGTFKWEKTYLSTTEEGDKTLNLVAYSGAGTALPGGTATLSVRVDNTPPAAPVVTTPSSNPYLHQAPSDLYSLVGTVPSDMVALVGPGGVSVPISGGWSYSTILVDGASADFTFYGFDLAGNQSATTTQTITWNPSVTVYMAGSFPGGAITDSGTSFAAETSGHPVPSRSVDGVTSYSIETGFNFITNQLRGL